MTIILVVLLVLFLVGGLGAPNWAPTAQWGYAPGGIIGTILILVLVLWLLGVV